MIQSNSVEAIRNQIKEIILLEKNAKMLFNDIVEPFVNELYQQKMVPVQTLRENGWSALLERYPQLENDVVMSRLCDFVAGPLEWREIIIEMIRFAIFIKLLKFTYSSELIESTCNSLKNDQILPISSDNCKNIILTYLRSDSVFDEIERSFYNIDASGAERMPDMVTRYISRFLESNFPEARADKAMNDDVVLKLLKFLNSRMIHLPKPTYQDVFSVLSINVMIYFFKANRIILSSGKVFCGFCINNNHEVFAKYLYQTGDLVTLIFAQNTNFFKLFQIYGEDVKYYREYLPTRSLKALFDMNVVYSDYSKNKLQKVIAFIKYYCWHKWIALFVDRFITKKGNINPNLDVGLAQKKENMEPIKESNQDKKTTITEPKHKNDNDQQTI